GTAQALALRARVFKTLSPNREFGKRVALPLVQAMLFLKDC
ncbi:MAG: hypothetical protein ACI92G_003415, partial [Candidatus Pelagisphaera sp.]